MTREPSLRSLGTILPLALSAVLAMPLDSSGQISPLQVEFNGGLSAPVQELSGPEGFEGRASSGASLGVHFALTTRSYLTWYVGFGQHRFGCERDCGGVDDIVSTSWDLGARVNVLSGPVVPWVRLGMTSHVTELDQTTAPDASTVRIESDRGWGVEAAAGLLIPVAPRLAFNPGVRYTRVTTDFDRVGDLALRFLVVDVGVVLGF